jgi:hypothetical protein
MFKTLSKALAIPVAAALVAGVAGTGWRSSTAGDPLAQD